MSPKDFVLAALRYLGAKVGAVSDTVFEVTRDGRTERIAMEPDGTPNKVYSPQTASFARLVDEVIGSGLHAVDDVVGAAVGPDYVVGDDALEQQT